MGKLGYSLTKRSRSIKRKEKDIELPEYGLGGVVKRKPQKSKKTLVIVLAVFTVLFAVIYVPPLFYQEPSVQGTYFVQPDAAGIKNVLDYQRDNPNADFDEDGLTNAQEAQYDTSARRFDTDNDGISDYAELFITETNPNKYEKSLVKLVQEKDKEEGKQVGTPYKIHEVVLWADDIESKAYGGLVRTHKGYRFCNFKGWAQFPKEGKAYKIVNGVHVPLEYKTVEKAWRIEDDYEVVLYDEPLEMLNQLSFFGIGTVYMGDSFIGNTLSKLLPNQGGLITCRRVSRQDTWVDASKVTTAPIRKIDYDYNEFSRYGRSHNQLGDLARVYQTIDEGHCVLTSLNSADDGEVIAIIYGYTAMGDLLVANKDTLEPVGTLTIQEKAGKIMNKDGELVQHEWFEFMGCGFNSEENADRISFFAASVAGIYSNNSTPSDLPASDTSLN